ncbi:MAG: lytic transglycosylase domain-containing protein [Chthoniobacterales bacterium]|nr:lytic transglycosylase domain-containing protein [Chthoniobacterales bacterium]
MSARIIYVLAAVAVLFAAGIGIFAAFENDPAYRVGELLGFGRYSSYDDLIAGTASRHGVDPLLVKAVIWQESRFHPDKLGSHGERGLMQVTEPAAQDWVAAEGIETFVPTDLLDPKTNIEAGTWYLGKALAHWSGQNDPLPFALGEYNAGRSRVKRWSGGGAQMTAQELSEAMDIPSTRAYVAAVLKRYEYYKKRGDQITLPQD